MLAPQPPAIVKRMIDAALKAAHIAILRRKQGVNVKQKTDGSRVTSGDYQAQQIIESELALLTQAVKELLGVTNIGFVMEETLPHDHYARDPHTNWVVDPIDGTIGYSRKLGERASPWAVSIALVKDGQTVSAVVYEASEAEYGTKREDFDALDPAHPGGTIFWADSSEHAAYALSGRHGAFRVAPRNKKESYAQRTVAVEGGELPILVTIPAFDVHFSTARVTRLDAATKLKPGAKALIDVRGDDGFIARTGFKEGEYEPCLSAVSGAMRAADGRASAFIAAQCHEWDHAAATLILDKSRTAYSRHARKEAA